MLRPLKLKEIHTYEYIELNREGLIEFFQLGITTSPFTGEDLADYYMQSPASPITVKVNDTQVGVFATNFVVLQKDSAQHLTGLIAFDNESKMLEFFDKVEE